MNSPTYTGTAVGTFPGAAGSSATFDVTAAGGSYSASVNGAGSGYIVNDVIRIDGSTFGGTSSNHANIRVTAVTGGGAIQTISVLGTAPAQTVTYNTVAFTGGNGASAAFNVTRNAGAYSYRFLLKICKDFKGSLQEQFKSTNANGNHSKSVRINSNH